MVSLMVSKTVTAVALTLVSYTLFAISSTASSQRPPPDGEVTVLTTVSVAPSSTLVEPAS